MVDLSIISPVYGCAGCLEALHHRVSVMARGLGVSYEIVLVDDRGPDDSWLVMTALARADPAHVRAIRLSRNYGQHEAITAGLAECRGRAAVVMDCDLQDAPEDIPRLYEKFRAGHQVVLTRRVGRQHGWPKRLTARLYAVAIRALGRHRMRPDVGSFSLVGRPVIDSFLQFKDINRHYLYILSWLGFDPVYVDYAHQPRAAGRSGYTPLRLLRHALRGAFFQSTELLEVIVLLGVLISLLGLGVGFWAFARALTGKTLPGWASTVVVTCLLGGFVIFIQGVIGLYVGQIFDQVKQRPLYVVADRVGGEDDGEGEASRPAEAVRANTARPGQTGC
jgi:dolichol-phosphate mannosyltransferase